MVKDLIDRYKKIPPNEYVSPSCVNNEKWKAWIKENAWIDTKSKYSNADRAEKCVSLAEFLDYIYERYITACYKVADDLDKDSKDIYDIITEGINVDRNNHRNIKSDTLLQEMIDCYSDEKLWIRNKEE